MPEGPSESERSGSLASMAREFAGVIAVIGVFALLARVGPSHAAAGVIAGANEGSTTRLSDGALQLFDECLNPAKVVHYNKPR